MKGDTEMNDLIEVFIVGFLRGFLLMLLALGLIAFLVWDNPMLSGGVWDFLRIMITSGILFGLIAVVISWEMNK